ncbi:MAG TPA: hypothetical protein VFN67_18870 [Polyangiales bacterium]|nr:hypothetical protein [Polyangiales bacterium]
MAADGTASVKHEVQATLEAPDKDTWKCTNTPTFSVELADELSGSYANGSIRVSHPEPDGAPSRQACSKQCGWCGVYHSIKMALFKRVGDQLIMTRTDGENVQEQIFVRAQSS